MNIRIEKLQGLLAEQKGATQQRMDSEWWKGYNAALHWIGKEVFSLAAPAAPVAQATAPDPVVEANRQLLLDRSRVGVEKYGVTLAASGLTQRQLLRHALEETLDLANYIQAILSQPE